MMKMNAKRLTVYCGTDVRHPAALAQAANDKSAGAFGQMLIGCSTDLLSLELLLADPATRLEDAAETTDADHGHIEEGAPPFTRLHGSARRIIFPVSPVRPAAEAREAAQDR